MSNHKNNVFITLSFTADEIANVNALVSNYPNVSRHELLKLAAQYGLTTLSKKNLSQLSVALQKFKDTAPPDRYKF
jgi:hypothetical protein